MNLKMVCKVCDSFITMRMSSNNREMCDHCFAEMNLKELGHQNSCTACDSPILSTSARKRKNGLCDRCFLDKMIGEPEANPNPNPDLEEKPTLRLFKADLRPDERAGHSGFYMVILAENKEQAKVFVQAHFNVEYEHDVDVFAGRVKITEIEGPFPAGKVLISLHY